MKKLKDGMNVEEIEIPIFTGEASLSDKPMIQQESPILFKKEIESFLGYCQLEKGLAENSIEAYRRDLIHFSKFSSEFGLHRLETIELQNILDYVKWLIEVQSLTGTSVKRHRVSIRQFFHYMVNEASVLTVNPAEQLEGLRSEMPVPTVISKEQVDLLLSLPHKALKAKGAEISSSKKSQFLRDAAMLELMYGTGLRVSELIELKRENWKEDFVEVIGKGNKQRVVPIHLEVKRLVREYWNTIEGTQTPFVFLTTHRKPMTRQNFWMIIKKYAKQAGIHEGFSPHCLRHAFATHMLMNDVNLRHLQAMLGHSDIKTTEVYTYVANQQLKIAHQKYHPRGISSV